MGNGTNGGAHDETHGDAHDEIDGDGSNDGPREGTKERRTYYTDDRVAAARANVERYDWAAERAEAAISRAGGVVAEGLEALWEAVPGQRIPRAGLVGDGNGRETWKPTEGRPWKITDGDVVLPTNDFAAYRESGRDERGFFDPELADDSLLVNEEYPGRPADWGVDDGTGWRDADGDVADPGTVLVPVAFYAHFYRWYELWDDLEALRDAFCYTGEDRYGRAGCVLLDRIADAYPRMDVGAYSSERFWNSHGGTGAGKVVGSIWETNLVRNLVSSYDALFPAFADDEVGDVLAEKRAAYPALPETRSPATIRGNVERGIVREVLPAVEGAQIRGNLGMHQAALAMAAVVMDEPDGYTGEAIDFLFRPGELRTVDGEGFREVERETADCEWELTGGDLGPALVEKLDRDGYGYEAAPNYNLIIRNQLARVADVLERYDPPEGCDGSAPDRRFDLYDHPKLRPAMAAYYPLVLLDRYLPSIGDSGLTGNPERKVTAERAVRSFEIYDDPTFAQVAHLLNGESVDGLEGDLFSPDADAVPDRIADAVAERGRYAPGSVLEPSYGFAALRQGSRRDDAAVTGDGSAGTDEKRDEDAAETVAAHDGDTRRATTLYFGRNAAETGSSHCHADALDLGIYAHDLALAPDLGYPEHTGDWPKRRWTSSTVAHNAVVVDEGNQHPIRVGDPLLFDDAGFVSVVDVDAPGAYPRTDEYRRTTVQVAVDDAASYVVDVFRVTGGGDHLFSFHGAEGDVTLEGLAPSPREGTLAGPDVPFPEHGEETAHNREVGNGFDYLRNLTRDDDPPDRFAVDWDVADAWDVLEADDDRDVHLRLTMLGGVDSVALADGEPPRKGGNPESLRYLLARRTAADGGTDLHSAFRSVLEPYVDEPRVVDVAEPELAVAGSETGGDEGDGSRDVRAIRVELDTGRTDWIVAAGTSDAEYAVDGRFRARGSLAFYAERGGAPARAYLADGTHLRSLASEETLCERETPTHLEGRVVDFTRDLAAENEIVLECEGPIDLEGAVGRHLHVATDDGDRPADNGVYEIASLESDGDRVIVDVGDATTVEGFADPDDPDAGYEHVVAVGAAARVPAAERWAVDE